MDEQLELPEIESRLRRLGASLQSELANREVASAVVDTIRRGRVAPDLRPRRRIGLIAAVVTVGLVLTTTAAWAAKTLVFDGGAVTVQRGPAPTTTPLVVRIGLGERIGLAQARTLPTFLQPVTPWLDAPPTAWLDHNVPGQLSLSYPPAPALPEVSHTGLGLLIQIFEGDGRQVIRKYLANDTNAEPVHIGRADAIFLHGGDHTLFYLKPDGSYATVPGRLAGNTLILRRDDRLTIRIEAELPLPRMIELARSLRRRH